MERPYYSRSIISDQADRLEIVIPVKRNWLQLIVLSLSLLICTLALLLILYALVDAMTGDRQNLMMMLPAAFLLLAGIQNFRTLIWKWKGAETITVQHGKLLLKRRTVLKDLTEVYEWRQINNLRVYDDSDDWVWGKHQMFKANSMIRFEYGSETVRFATEISYAEAEYLLELINTRIP